MPESRRRARSTTARLLVVLAVTSVIAGAGMIITSVLIGQTAGDDPAILTLQWVRILLPTLPLGVLVWIMVAKQFTAPDIASGTDVEADGDHVDNHVDNTVDNTGVARSVDTETETETAALHGTEARSVFAFDEAIATAPAVDAEVKPEFEWKLQVGSLIEPPVAAPVVPEPLPAVQPIVQPAVQPVSVRDDATEPETGPDREPAAKPESGSVSDIETAGFKTPEDTDTDTNTDTNGDTDRAPAPDTDAEPATGPLSDIDAVPAGEDLASGLRFGSVRELAVAAVRAGDPIDVVARRLRTKESLIEYWVSKDRTRA